MRSSRLYSEAWGLIIPLIWGFGKFLRDYLHGKKEVPYDTNACFIDEEHKAKYLKRTLTRFKLKHQLGSNSQLWASMYGWG